MITMYFTPTDSDRVLEVLVQKATRDTVVTMEGHREHKVSRWGVYHETERDAVKYLHSDALDKVHQLIGELHNAKERLKTIQEKYYVKV